MPITTRLTDDQQQMAASALRLADYLAVPYLRQASGFGTSERDDILSDAYLAVCEAAGTWRTDGGATFPGYAGQQVKHRIVDGFRSRWGRAGQRDRARLVPIGLPTAGTKTTRADSIPDQQRDFADSIAEADPVRRAIRRLPKRLRWVVTQTRPYGERTLADVATDLGVTEARVHQLRTQAYARLRDDLQADAALGRP